MRKVIVVILFVFFGLVIFHGLSQGMGKVHANQRQFIVTKKISLSNLKKGKDVRVWISYPVSDEWQSVDEFKLISMFKAEVIHDEKYGNKMLYFHVPSHEGADLDIEVNFKITRKEYSFDKRASLDEGNLSLFLEPNQLVYVNEETQVLARDIAKGKNTEIEKVRAIYDYIIDEFTYTKTDPRVCKTGNSRMALNFKKGQCSEYHSAFISLVRSLGIPAKFELGFSISPDKKEGELRGYHCWAKFYVKNKGWFPVDISEADKHPEDKEYFFGNINKNRVQFSMGRDITLSYAQDTKAMPLCYFIYPYIEVDGQEFFDADVTVSFEKL